MAEGVKFVPADDLDAIKELCRHPEEVQRILKWYEREAERIVKGE